MTTKLIADLTQNAGFAVHAWGFEGTLPDYNHVSRNLRPDFYSVREIGSLVEDDGERTPTRGVGLRANEAMTVHRIKHGEHKKTSMERREVEVDVQMPRIFEWMTRIFGPKTVRQRQIQEYEYERTIVRPSLGEIITTGREEDAVIMLYYFAHAGYDESRRPSNPIATALVTSVRRYNEVAGHLREDFSRIYPFFKELAGDFPKKDIIFNPKLNRKLEFVGGEVISY